MASLLQKLLARQSARGVISVINRSQPSNLPILSTQIHQNPIFQQKTEDSIPSRSVPIFPSFPFGLSLNPISSNGLALPDDADDVSGDGSTIWADSVKKKRKKKMNKHKYKKLRKSMKNKH